MTSSNPGYLPKTPSLNTLSPGLKVSTCELWGVSSSQSKQISESLPYPQAVPLLLFPFQKVAPTEKLFLDPCLLYFPLLALPPASILSASLFNLSPLVYLCPPTLPTLHPALD